MNYVSRRYLAEKWDRLKWDMESVIGVYRGGNDNVADESKRVKSEIAELMNSIIKELENE